MCPRRRPPSRPRPRRPPAPVARASAGHRDSGALAGQRRRDRPADPRLAPTTRAVLPEIPSSMPEKLSAGRRRPQSVTVSAMANSGDLYEQLVDAANAIYGSHQHQRALHAKGTWCRNLRGQPGGGTALPGHPLPGRPGSRPRPLFERRQPGSTLGARREGWRSSCTPRRRGRDRHPQDHQPPSSPGPRREFLELLQLRRPDETGQPDMEARRLPRRASGVSAAIQATIGGRPPAGLAQLAYRSPPRSSLSMARGRGPGSATAGAGGRRGQHSRRRGARARPRLPERGARRAPSPGPGRLRAAAPGRRRGRPHRRPNRHLAEDRQLVGAGRLEITEIVDDPESDDHIDVAARSGSSTASSSRTTRSSTPAPGPTRSRPIGAWASRSRTRRPLRRLPSSPRRARTGAARSRPGP